MLILAHRGAFGDGVENTLSAFERALKLGADGFELDLRRCRSGELVVHHDETLMRLAGDPRSISALSLSELRGISLQGSERVPTLDEVLELAASAQVVNLELKVERFRPTGIEEALQVTLSRHARLPRLLLSSFHPMALYRLQALCPAIERGLLYGQEQRLPLRRGWHRLLLRLSALHPEHSLLTKESVQAMQARGFRVHTWTVDQAARVRELADYGVDAVITNDVVTALSARAEAYSKHLRRGL